MPSSGGAPWIGPQNSSPPSSTRLRAPSVHNTQPWRWRIERRRGAAARRLDPAPRRDRPDRRDLVLSCGAALHHLLVALAARGLEARGRPAARPRRHRAPRHGDAPARCRPRRRRGAVPAIDRRRTDRRRMSHRPGARHEHLRVLDEHAHRAGAVLVPVTDPAMRQRLTAALADGRDTARSSSPGYATELELWTRRYAGARDGVPAGNIAPPPIGAVARRTAAAVPARAARPAPAAARTRRRPTTRPSCW